MEVGKGLPLGLLIMLHFGPHAGLPKAHSTLLHSCIIQSPALLANSVAKASEAYRGSE